MNWLAILENASALIAALAAGVSIGLTIADWRSRPRETDGNYLGSGA